MSPCCKPRWMESKANTLAEPTWHFCWHVFTRPTSLPPPLSCSQSQYTATIQLERDQGHHTIYCWPQLGLRGPSLVFTQETPKSMVLTNLLWHRLSWTAAGKVGFWPSRCCQFPIPNNLSQHDRDDVSCSLATSGGE